MTTKQILFQIRAIKPQIIGKKPVVILPLEQYEQIKAKLELSAEDLEMAQSSIFKAAIAKVRKEKKLYSSAELKSILKL